MKFLDLVKKRRSCRRYLKRAVPREIIDRCLEAARLAPSACNSQPWYFIAVDTRDLIEKLAEKAFSGIYSINSFIKDASVLIVVIREPSTYVATLGSYFRGTRYNLIDIGIACEHFVLQAEEEGLGTCLIGWFNEKALKKILHIPRSKKVDIVISVGYPAEKPLSPHKRKNLSEIRQYR